MKTIKIVAVLMLIIALASFKLSNTQDVVAEFENMLKRHFTSYRANPRMKVTKLAGGWVNQRFASLDDYKFDVEKTGSPALPYSGFCDFTLKRSMTEFHATKREAQQDVNFVKSDVISHRHYYGYQKGRWIVTKRQNKSNNNWSDCNEAIKTGENAGESNVKGCWEE